jgi:hypothetical protein
MTPEQQIEVLRAERDDARAKLARAEVLLGMPHERRLLVHLHENLKRCEALAEEARAAVREVEDVAAVRRMLAEERSAKESWRTRALDFEAALDAARRETPHDTEGPDPRPALRALEEARAKEGT